MQDGSNEAKGINIQFGGQPPQQQQGLILNDAPARAKMAMDFSLTMARRASPMIAVNDVGIQQIEPAKLTPLEQAAWDAACTALADYFNGQLDTDQFEDTLVEAVGVETDRRRTGRVIDCGVCQGKGFLVNQNQDRLECGLCEGAGRIIVVPHFCGPLNSDMDDEEEPGEQQHE